MQTKLRPIIVEVPIPLYEKIVDHQYKIWNATKKVATLKSVIVTALTKYLEQENKPTSHKREVPNE